jgi:hypothetical protein
MSRFFSDTAPAAASAAASGQATTAQPEQRSTEFRPVTGGGEVAPGEVLLVEAYAAFWIVAIVMIVRSMRRQRRLDERIGRLERDLAQARADGTTGGGPRREAAADDEED